MFGDHNIVLGDDSDDCRVIAAVVSNMRRSSEVSANANLIAAAPALLDFVASYIDAWEAGTGTVYLIDKAREVYEAATRQDDSAVQPPKEDL